MIDLSGVSLTAVIIIFLISAAVIAVAGTKLAYVAEKIALKTGIGQALIGAVMVGISTSLSGTVMSFYSAFYEFAELSVANSIGGIAAQIAFLAIADITYRKANLEHAGSSLENMAQGALLIMLLTIPVIATLLPSVTFRAVHPASPLLIIGYVAGMYIVRNIKTDPMWRAERTPETQKEDEGDDSKGEDRLGRLFLSFAILIALMFITGLGVATSAIELSERTGLSQTLVGGIFTSVSTSLPELVTALAAVRRGAVNLAIGNIMGGNAFDVLFLAGSDVFFRPGSIYHHITDQNLLVIAVAILMTSVLLLGLMRREKLGFGGIGFESTLVLGLYAFLITALTLF